MCSKQMSHFVLSNYCFCQWQMGTIITRSIIYSRSFTVSKRATMLLNFVAVVYFKATVVPNQVSLTFHSDIRLILFNAWLDGNDELTPRVGDIDRPNNATNECMDRDFSSIPLSASDNVSGGLFEQFLLGCTHPVQSLPAMSASGCQADTGVLRMCASEFLDACLKSANGTR